MNNLRVSIILLAVIFLPPVLARAQGDGDLHIYCINVSNSTCAIRQGDSTLIVSPTGKRLLIDGGADCGANYVTDTFTRVIPAGGMDYMIATNWNNDHVQGMATIATYHSNQYMPQIIYDLGDLGDPGCSEPYCTTFAGKRLTPTAGDFIDMGDGPTVTFICVDGNIFDGIAVVPVVGNDRSIGVLIKYGDFDYVSCSDLSSPVEDPLGAALKTLGRKIDILHVSNHGAGTSTSNAYCANIQPRYAIISCGNGSTDPSQKVIYHLNGKTDTGGTPSPTYPPVETIYLTEESQNNLDGSNVAFLQSESNRNDGGSLHVTVRSGGCQYDITNEKSGTNPIDSGSVQLCVGTPTPTPEPVTNWPIFVRANKHSFSRSDHIEITADFQICQIPFWPYIRLRDPSGNYLYIQRTYPRQQTRLSRGAAAPFRAGAPFVLDFPLDYYPVLSTRFTNALPGTWVLEGYFLDYYGQTLGGVSRQQLTVSTN